MITRSSVRGLEPHHRSFDTKVESIYFGRKATLVQTKPFGYVFVCTRTKLIKPEKNCLATSDIKKDSKTKTKPHGR